MKRDEKNMTIDGRAAERRSAVRHTAIFAVVCAMLAILNIATSPYPWVLWVIGGWGFGLAIQWVSCILPEDRG